MWTSFLYYFIGGGLFFMLGIVTYLVKAPKKTRDYDGRRSLFWVLATFVLYFLITLIWQVLVIRGQL